MRVVFITPEEPSVVPLFFEKALPSVRGKVAAVVVVSPIYRNSTWMRQAKRFIGSFGLKDFIEEAVFFVGYKCLDLMQRLIGVGGFHSVKSVVASQNVPLLEAEDVNDAAFLERLKELPPDLIISVSCPQIFRKALLELPTRGCVNVHSALLPNYRGMLPTFWALTNGEQQTGVTVHYMNPGIDDGDIILQRSIPIGPDATLRSLMKECKTVAADMVLEVIRQFEEDSLVPVPNNIEEGAYFSFPKREDVARFKAQGHRLR